MLIAAIADSAPGTGNDTTMASSDQEIRVAGAERSYAGSTGGA